MSLVELIARADTRGLAASGLACLDRCVPLLDGDDEALRPLWATLADGSGDAPGPDWAEALAQVRDKLAGPDATGEDEAVVLARRMLAAAPAECSGPALRTWADACSAASLRIHRLLDPAAGAAPEGDVPRDAGTEGLPARRRRTAPPGRRPGTARRARRGRGASGSGGLHGGAPRAARGGLPPGPGTGLNAGAAVGPCL